LTLSTGPDTDEDLKGIASLIFTPIYRGITAHIMERFDLEQLCRNIQTSKATLTYVVPPVVVLLAKSPVVDKYDLSSLRLIQSAAAPLSSELIEMVYKKLGVPIKQTYGMSEMSPAISAQVWLTSSSPTWYCFLLILRQSWEDWDKTMGSVGKLFPSMAMKIMRNDHELPADQEGEVWLKGPNIFKGYYKNPKATAESIVDGWFRSGDIGYIDSDGHLYLTDRLKELIKYNGFQVAPAQLEGFLLGHPAVNDVAVVGVYVKERATELPRAYVVLAKGYNSGMKLEKEISEWLHGQVAPYKRLRGGVRFVDSIPKSAAGKLLRRVLVERAKLEEEERTAKAKL